MTAPNRSVDFAINNVAEVIQKSLVDFTREDLYIGMPATVVGIDNYETQQVVDVKPVINDQYEDEQLVKAVTLKSIFVKLPSGGGFDIKLPIAVGDKVTLHYCHRDISTYLDGKGEDVDAALSLTADIRDCYITHGFGTRLVNQSPSATDMIISGPNTTITIPPSGIATVVTKEAYFNSEVFEVDAATTTFKQDVIFEKGITVTDDADIGGKPYLAHTHTGAGAGNPTSPPI